MNKTLKNIVFLFAKGTISIVLLYLLFSRINIDTILVNLRSFNPVYFLLAVLFFTISVFLTALRLKLFIPEKTQTTNILGICYIGFFFNICLPGIVGGNVVKIYYINDYLKKVISNFDKLNVSTIKKNIIAVGSVFSDQYMSLLTVLIFGTAVYPYSSEYLNDILIRLFIPSFFIIFVSSTILMLKFRIGRKINYLSEIYDYFGYIMSKKAILLKAFLYSILIQFIVILSVYILSKGFSLNISLLSIFTFMPIIIAFSLIPVSISGIGIRESAFVFLLGKIGISPEKSLTLSIIWFLSIVIGSLPGLVGYLCSQDNLNKTKVKTI